MQRVNIPGVGTVNFPDTMSSAEIERAIETEILPQFGGQQQPTRTQADPNNTNIFRDTAGALVSGAGAAVQFPGQVYGLVTGDFDTGSTRLGQRIREFGQDMKSEGLQERERVIQEAIRQAEGQGFTAEALAALRGYLSDPRALASLTIEPRQRPPRASSCATCGPPGRERGVRAGIEPRRDSRLRWHGRRDAGWRGGF